MVEPGREPEGSVLAGGPPTPATPGDHGGGLGLWGSGPATRRAAPRRRHTDRRAARRRDLVAVAAIAAAAAVLAVLLSDAAPTGTGWIDAVERALLAGAVAVAGSRARRWSLVPGTVIATAGTTFPAALAGAAALGVTMFLVERRLRSRAAGAAIGAVIGVLALRLSLPGPTGIESLLAAVATVPVLVSGHRRSTLRTRRAVRRGLAVTAGVAAVALIATAVAAVLSAGGLRRAVAATDRALEEARGGRGGSTSAELDDAHAELTSADGLIGAWWASGARAIPVVGANLAAVQRSVDAGLEITGRAKLVSHAEFDTVQRDGGGVDLAELDRIAPRLRLATAALDAAGDTVRASGSTWLVPSLRDRLDSLQARLDDATADGRDAVAVVDGLPAMLGAHGPRRYLFLLGNPAELRDLGGHIGNWVELVATDGDIDLVKVGRPRDLASTEPVDRFEGRYPASFLSMDPVLYPQNLGASPDLPTVARLASELFEARTGRTVDGVAYADPAAFAAFIRMTGPVAVPGLPGYELTADNAVEFLTRDQFTLFPDEDASGDALDMVIRTVFDRLTTTKLPGPQRLADMFGPLVRTGRFRLASLHRDDHRLLARFDLTGKVPDPAGRDLLGVFNRNANPSKIDTYLERRVRARIEWDPRSGAVWSLVTVDLHNTAPVGGVNRVVGGNSVGAPPGTNVTDLAVLTPFRLDTVTVDGVESVAQPLLEHGLWRHTVRVAVPPQASRRVEFHLQGVVDSGDVYHLDYVGQTLVRAGGVSGTRDARSAVRGRDVGDVSVVVDPTRGKIARKRGAGRTAGDAVRFSQDTDRTMVWRVEGVR